MEDQKVRRRLANNLLLLIKEKLAVTQEITLEFIERLEYASQALDTMRVIGPFDSGSSIGGCSVDGECHNNWSQADCLNPSINGVFYSGGCPHTPLRGTHQKPAELKTGEPKEATRP